MEIIFDKVTKNYGPINVFRDLDLKIKAGDFIFVTFHGFRGIYFN